MDLSGLLHYLVWIYPLVYFCICYALASSAGFFISLSDFWSSFVSYRYMDIRKPASFYNGFFPLGYAVLLRTLSFGRPLYAPFIYNALFGTVCLYGIVFLGMKTMDSHWVLVAILGLSLFPKFFKYAITPGTDIGLTAFTTSGAVVLLLSAVMGQAGAGSIWTFFFGGARLGLAARWG